MNIAAPRYFHFGKRRVSAYQVFLGLGIYCGILVSAVLSQSSGLSPLRIGAGSLFCAIAGLIGARIYHWLFARRNSHGSTRGSSLLGGLAIVPASWIVAHWLQLPWPVFGDCAICGVIVGVIFGRIGCIQHGCCGGRITQNRHGHPQPGSLVRRIPVRELEIVWWLVAGVAVFWSWDQPLPPGSRALAVLAWYGFGRFWLEPLREASDRVFGGIRINQLVAALLALSAGSALALRLM